MEGHKIFSAAAVTVLVLSASVLSTPVGESQPTPSLPEVSNVKINSSFMEVMNGILNSTDLLPSSSPTTTTGSPPHPPTTTATTSKPTTPPTTTTSTTTPKPHSVVTVNSVPFWEKESLESHHEEAPLKPEVLPPPVESIPKPVPPTTAPQAFANDLASLVSNMLHPQPSASPPPVVESHQTSPNKDVLKGNLVQDHKTLTASDGSPIQLSSSSFTSNEAQNDTTLDPIVAALLKEYQRNTRTPDGSQIIPNNTTVKKDEALSPHLNEVLPIPFVTPQVLHVDPQTGQVFVQQFPQPQNFQPAPTIPTKPLPPNHRLQPPKTESRWSLWNLFGWTKSKPTTPPLPPPNPTEGIHVIKAKKNLKPGEPYYECPLVKAFPPQPQQPSSPLSFM